MPQMSKWANVLVSICLLSACNGARVLGDKDNDRGANAGKPVEADEEALLPGEISGAYLVCVPATKQSENARIGCAFRNSQNATMIVNVKAIAKVTVTQVDGATRAQAFAGPQTLEPYSFVFEVPEPVVPKIAQVQAEVRIGAQALQPVMTRMPTDGSAVINAMAAMQKHRSASFTLGERVRLVLDADHLIIEPGFDNGTYLSEVIAHAANPGAMLSLLQVSWLPAGPYRKNLPSPATPEDSSGSYPTDNATSALLSGMVGLWHMDVTEGAALPARSPIPDSSGSGLSGFVASGTGTASAAHGRIRGGVKFAGAGDAIVLPANSTVLRSKSAISVNIWYNPQSLPPGAGLCSALFDITTSRIEDTRFNLSICHQGIISIRAQATDTSPVAIASTGSAVVTLNVEAKNWQMITGVANFVTGTLAVYHNGVEKVAVRASFGAILSGDTANAAMSIGGQNGGVVNPLLGIVDEAVLFARALTADEIMTLYRRGASTIGVRVRMCQKRDCRDNPPPPWQGLSASVLAFADDYNDSPQYPIFPLSGLIGPYVQYQAIFHRDNVNDLSPRLQALMLEWPP